MYEDKAKENSSFSTRVPGLQIAWDSTSLGLLKTCPRKYQYSMLDNWQEKDGALPLTFGIHFHSALEHYDKQKAEGVTHDEATASTVRYILDKAGTRNEQGVFFPWITNCNVRNRETLIRAIVWYLEHFRDDPASTVILANGKPAVELSFKMELPIPSPDGEPYLLCGHLDRVVEFGEDIYVMDRKTTGQAISSYYMKQWSPNNQMSLYTYAANVILPKSAKGVIIDAVQLGVTFCRMQRAFVLRSKEFLEEWLEDTLKFIKLAEHYAETGYWPMNDTACTMYGGCQYLEVCSKSPSVRNMYLESDFKKRIWDPLQTRE